MMIIVLDEYFIIAQVVVEVLVVPTVRLVKKMKYVMYDYLDVLINYVMVTVTLVCQLMHHGTMQALKRHLHADDVAGVAMLDMIMIMESVNSENLLVWHQIAPNEMIVR